MTRVARLVARLAALLALLSIPACDGWPPTPRAPGDAAAVTSPVADDAGVEHDPRLPRRRVVSLIPGVTEVIVGLGAGERLVGRTRFDTQPELAGVASVGGGLDPSVESIVSLRPDLVVAWPDGDLRSTVSRLGDAGTPVYQANYRTRADVERHIANLGRLLGRDDAARALLDGLADESRALDRALDGAPRPTVLYVVSLEPLMTTGPDTFLDAVLEDAGAVNLFHDASGLWPQVSFEEVVRRSPDYIVVPGPGGEGDAPRLDERPGWSSLPAVREGRVIVVDADLFSRPGPNLHRAARTLAARLHPDRVNPPS